MMNTMFRKMFMLVAFAACAGIANAQLPNEKFGKPSKMEWDFNGWGDAVNADAIILCKTMKVTYQLSDQMFNTNMSDQEISIDNLVDMTNQIDDSNILVKYEIGLRTKILKPDGAKHANIDITYFSDNDKISWYDDLQDLKIRVFTKNEKGKVEKRNVNTDGFVKERVDDHYMVMHVVVPDVQPGSIIEYQYNITSVRPTFLYDWVFQECIPTLRSKCDIEIPAFLQFRMNAPTNKLVKSSVVAGRLSYDNNRSDLKKGKTCITNHYFIVGDYIRPEDEKVAVFTSQIAMPNVTVPAAMPNGSTHLKVK
ncbi:MAG: DUF3857 domain-containing protein [Prevotella sp.]|nr:DUF3857 domain-containing protein [Prevotella sp.]